MSRGIHVAEVFGGSSVNRRGRQVFTEREGVGVSDVCALGQRNLGYVGGKVGRGNIDCVAAALNRGNHAVVDAGHAFEREECGGRRDFICLAVELAVGAARPVFADCGNRFVFGRVAFNVTELLFDRGIGLRGIDAAERERVVAGRLQHDRGRAVCKVGGICSDYVIFADCNAVGVGNAADNEQILCRRAGFLCLGVGLAVGSCRPVFVSRSDLRAGRLVVGDRAEGSLDLSSIHGIDAAERERVARAVNRNSICVVRDVGRNNRDHAVGANRAAFQGVLDAGDGEQR